MLQQTSLRARSTATYYFLAYSMSTDPRDAAQLAERRQARDGYAYTAIEFQEFYGDHWQTLWDAASVVESSDSHQVAQGSVPQPAAGHIQLGVYEVRLDSAMLVQIRQQEAARGPPRSLHKMARDALQQMSQSRIYESKNLDDLFDWVPYVAAHASCDKIIGPGITHAMAHFVPQTRDLNRGGAPRCDFFFYRKDQTVCRVHPGRRPKDDAQLIFQ